MELFTQNEKGGRGWHAAIINSYASQLLPKDAHFCMYCTQIKLAASVVFNWFTRTFMQGGEATIKFSKNEKYPKNCWDSVCEYPLTTWQQTTHAKCYELGSRQGAFWILSLRSRNASWQLFLSASADVMCDATPGNQQRFLDSHPDLATMLWVFLQVAGDAWRRKISQGLSRAFH